MTPRLLLQTLGIAGSLAVAFPIGAIALDQASVGRAWIATKEAKNCDGVRPKRVFRSRPARVSWPSFRSADVAVEGAANLTRFPKI